MKVSFLAIAFVFTGVVVLCGLGYWQVERMAWKKGILERLERVYAQDAALGSLTDKDFSEIVTQDNPYIFKRGFLTGRFLYDKTIMISPKTFEGKIGAHVITPFAIAGGSAIVLVNRGWIPQGGEKDLVRQDGLAEEAVTLKGMVRSAPERNAFTPANSPEKGQWYFLDVAQVGHDKGLDHVLAHIFIVEEIDGTSPQYPLAAGGRIEISNNHAQYALFWFSMAFVLIVVSAIRFMSRH